MNQAKTVTAAVHKKSAHDSLRYIAVFKFMKAIVLIGTGLGALELLHPAVVDLLKVWADALPLGAEQHFAQKALAWVTGLSPRRIKALGLGAFVFAAVFVTEGTGLWLRKVWAEWLTVCATAALIPLELWELYLHPNPPKGFALGLNILVVGYLIRQIRSNTRSRF